MHGFLKKKSIQYIGINLTKCGFELHGFFLEPKTAHLEALYSLKQGLTENLKRNVKGQFCFSQANNSFFFVCILYQVYPKLPGAKESIRCRFLFENSKREKLYLWTYKLCFKTVSWVLLLATWKFVTLFLDKVIL